MYRLIILGSLLCLLSSSQSQPSAALLPQAKMVAILVDLELAAALIDHHTDDKDTARWLLRENVLLICQAHEVALDTFQESYEHYLAHLETMQEIYGLVNKRIEEFAAQL
ncbi:MAG: DUF4296 domain-containing protein [Bacteroidota bacterium]